MRLLRFNSFCDNKTDSTNYGLNRVQVNVQMSKLSHYIGTLDENWKDDK